jgi:hypothetical protein
MALAALLGMAAAMAAVMLITPHGGRERKAPAKRPTSAVSPRRLPPPVSAAVMLQGRQVAARFLAGYLAFVYGRGSARAIRGITPALRRGLLEQRAQLTPMERRRRPRVMSLQTIGTTPGFVVATAVIDDGSVATYRLRFTLQRRAAQWAVSSIEEG